MHDPERERRIQLLAATVGAQQVRQRAFVGRGRKTDRVLACERVVRLETDEVFDSCEKLAGILQCSTWSVYHTIRYGQGLYGHHYRFESQSPRIRIGRTSRRSVVNLDTCWAYPSINRAAREIGRAVNHVFRAVTEGSRCAMERWTYLTPAMLSSMIGDAPPSHFGCFPLDDRVLVAAPVRLSRAAQLAAEIEREGTVDVEDAPAAAEYMAEVELQFRRD